MYRRMALAEARQGHFSGTLALGFVDSLGKLLRRYLYFQFIFVGFDFIGCFKLHGFFFLLNIVKGIIAYRKRFFHIFFVFRLIF